jgi:hypothetical protein
MAEKHKRGVMHKEAKKRKKKKSRPTTTELAIWAHPEGELKGSRHSRCTSSKGVACPTHVLA